MSNKPEHPQQKAKPFRVSPYVVRITTIMVFIIALMRMPHPFYTVIHLFIFIICCLSLGPENWKRRPLWTAAVVIAGLIYNPIIPVHLDRALWILVNIPTAMLFFHVLDDENAEHPPVAPGVFIEPKPSSSTITESKTVKKQEPPQK
jgi:hypothetical protein